MFALSFPRKFLAHSPFPVLTFVVYFRGHVTAWDTTSAVQGPCHIHPPTPHSQPARCSPSPARPSARPHAARRSPPSPNPSTDLRAAPPSSATQPALACSPLASSIPPAPFHPPPHPLPPSSARPGPACSSRAHSCPPIPRCSPLGGRPHPPTPALTCSLLASHVTDSTMSGRHLGLGGGGRARLNQASAAAVNLELIRRWCHLHRSHRRLRCRRRRRRRPGRRRPERPLPPPQLPVLREGRALLQLPDALQLMCNELPTLQSVSSTEQQPGNAAAGRQTGTECIRVGKTSISKTNIVPDIDESSISGCTDIEVEHFDIDDSSISGCTDIEDKTFDIDDSSI